MLKLELHGARRLLLLGAHADDIEIGCGGSILTVLAARPNLDIRWVVFSSEGKRREEARAGARIFLQGVKRASVVTKQFRESYFPSQFERIKSYFETLKSFEPDIILTHYRDDRHQDHRLLADLTWNTFRNYMILEYEIPKYDGDLGQPNFYIPLESEIAGHKARALCQVYKSQTKRHWFREDIFLALMRLRGVECASEFAEAFYCRKVVGG